MKVFKSLEAYNFFVSGWVKDVGSKLLKDRSRLVYGRVSVASFLKSFNSSFFVKGC